MQFDYRALARFTARQFVRLAGAWILSLLSIVPASAQVNEKELLEVMMSKIAGTQRVFAQPYMTGGKLAGCNLVFEARIRDYTYRQGQFIKVDGSIGIMGIGDKLGAVLKVVVNEITPPSLSFNPSPPSRAYLIGSKFETNVDSLVSADESDTPGSLFSVFQSSPTAEIVLAALESKKITVAFNKKGGPSDIQLPLELDVAQTDETGKRTRNDEAVEGFAQCATVLLEQMK
ncbi:MULTISPECIES: hypothetical protein [Rhizobium/Agrobacterium group]|uniref:Uncharacterized protein n=2 Tax=Rhizobium/Agrobacterium group TaxID=227290 RepID=B9JVE4_ALLAM|nr:MULTISPECIES: hypothetical protein [Rhizobium/Agrobacterium group]ACM36224.1 hypothetical protein Avi_1708 [Allorhizobium ampelinum S4]MCF1449245.1 hypothetical protein [Allorhizobium ampelinum]MCF1494840.1 hypothetical protein [Allorhizobium ampelinum]MUO30717.1 hypothetical protein [Agrobacterium vitis]MUO43844.1 hypothetical protein [Agrobacterium vitis]